MSAPKPPSPYRMPALLETAAQRVKLAARAATERAIESLGLAALATANVFQRDGLLGAQFELNRKSAIFALAFNDAFDERLQRESAPSGSGAGLTTWDALSLVDDREVERKVAAERFGLEVAHLCEWELRELDGYIRSLLKNHREHNPLRPEAVGLALMRGIEAVSDREEIRTVLQGELGRALATALRDAYQAIIADLRGGGVQPVGLSVRPTAEHGRYVSGYGNTVSPPIAPGDAPSTRGGHALHEPGPSGGHGSADFARSGPSRAGALGGGGRTTSRGTPIGHVDAQLMSLMRRLVAVDFVAASSGYGSGYGSGFGDAGGHGGGAMPANLIRAHRDELRQASAGALDHMVIDVIGSLFDQILSDPRVPPQMARQIARLQLPVLRAAMGDPGFFSSRRHPVRRFVNRLASLGVAIDDFDDEPAKRFLARVKALVNDVIEGDFDQIEVYERKLGELEQFVAELGREEVDEQGQAGAVLAAKEDALRVQQRYAQQLEGELKGLSGPEFVRDFLTEVWSQVLVRAAQRHGPASDELARLRGVARDLFMSVQPKGTPAQRKEFLLHLPKLMQGLNEGMDLIHWPESARKAFFGLLLPAHAESLKGQSMRTLDYNLLARQVDGAFARPMPSRDELPPPGVELPVLNDAIVVPQFSAEEAERVGLLDESKVDWTAAVEPAPPAAEPELAAEDLHIEGLPAPDAETDAVEPTQGEALADHVQVGFAYQMHLDDAWRKVKLAHVSTARTFFVFTQGTRHKKTISLTRRMLQRLCEAGRLRAFENAYLIDRATARARRQLAALAPSH